MDVGTTKVQNIKTSPGIKGNLKTKYNKEIVFDLYSPTILAICKDPDLANKLNKVLFEAINAVEVI